MSPDKGITPRHEPGLLIDTNLLVLFAVGSVNRWRIETFKRTRQYTNADFELLLRALENQQPLYTTAHVLAEVSNLTDLPGIERQHIRNFLREMILRLDEVAISSSHATDNPIYPHLGLADAAIATAARTTRCTVLTDDLDLYLPLLRQQIAVINFTHLRAQALGL